MVLFYGYSWLGGQVPWSFRRRTFEDDG